MVNLRTEVSSTNQMSSIASHNRQMLTYHPTLVFSIEAPTFDRHFYSSLSLAFSVIMLERDYVEKPEDRRRVFESVTRSKSQASIAVLFKIHKGLQFVLSLTIVTSDS